MAAAGQFVRERIPVPCSVPEAGRLILELISGFRGSEVEPAGPMTFRIIRRYRPTWASATGFLIFPLFVNKTEICRVAVIEAPIGAELLLEGTLDEDLHVALIQLGRVPEAARVSTLGARPMPNAFSPPPATAPPPSGAPYEAQHPMGAMDDARPDLIDLRGPAPSVDQHRPAAEPQVAGRQFGDRMGTGDEFSDLIPPPLLPPTPEHDSARRPAGPAPSFAPLPARQPEPASSNGSGNGRLPSAFKSPWNAAQQAGVLEDTERRPETAQPAQKTQQVTVSVDTGERSEIGTKLIIGRAPSRLSGEDDALLLTLNDPSLSVSKTHLVIESGPDGLWVTDRNSTNGTWIDENRGGLRPVPAGERTRVPEGARVLIGERVLTFSRT